MCAVPFAMPDERATVRVHPERAAPEELSDILVDGLVAHVGIIDHDAPVVIPMSYVFDTTTPRLLYLHGGHHSRLMQYMSTGAPLCITVTRVDGLVYSKTALYHSINYRSAVCFGIGRPVTDSVEARGVSERLVSRYFPGRTAGRDYEPLPDAHIEATAYVAVDIIDASAKVRRGGPKGPRDHDPAAAGTAGVLAFDPPG
jgi:nitroimidazol reductase NimA-like FMN-containing flavoprotein (pyridoxamine 5'-phosphate oxidase superfamily)